MLAVGLSLVSAAGWAAYRSVDRPSPPAMIAAAPTVNVETVAPTPLPPPQPAAEDLYDELARRALDAAVGDPPWSRGSLLDRMSPFDPSVAARLPAATSPADAPPTNTGNATDVASFEMVVQLGKGETIGTALKKRGFTAETIAHVIAALAPHVSLKRLPIGLDMTVEARPSGRQGGSPILEALTLHPEGGREIKVARNGEGNFAVERRR